MNLYTVHASIRVGRSTSTHFDRDMEFHVSTKSVADAATKGQMKAYRWAKKEFGWFLSTEPNKYIRVRVTGARLLDEGWL